MHKTCTALHSLRLHCTNSSVIALLAIAHGQSCRCVRGASGAAGGSQRLLLLLIQMLFLLALVFQLVLQVLLVVFSCCCCYLCLPLTN
jgi:hypothetical protein